MKNINFLLLTSLALIAFCTSVNGAAYTPKSGHRSAFRAYVKPAPEISPTIIEATLPKVASLKIKHSKNNVAFVKLIALDCKMRLNDKEARQIVNVANKCTYSKKIDKYGLLMRTTRTYVEKKRSFHIE